MGQLRRLAERGRPEIEFHLDGIRHHGLVGDTVLTAVLLAGHRLRRTEAGGAPRAGFCLMGACQECWIATEDGTALQACRTTLTPGLRLRSSAE